MVREYFMPRSKIFLLFGGYLVSFMYKHDLS